MGKSSSIQYRCQCNLFCHRLRQLQYGISRKPSLQQEDIFNIAFYNQLCIIYTYCRWQITCLKYKSLSIILKFECFKRRLMFSVYRSLWRIFCDHNVSFVYRCVSSGFNGIALNLFHSMWLTKAFITSFENTFWVQYSMCATLKLDLC